MVAVKHPNANTLVYHCAKECFHAEFDVDWLQVNGGEAWFWRLVFHFCMFRVVVLQSPSLGLK